jgi:hypothetical protein
MKTDVKTPHAIKRATERLSAVPDFKVVLATIRADRAKLVAFGHGGGRLIFDVPYGQDTVRVVVDTKLTLVVSVLPPEFNGRLHRREIKAKKSARARTRQKFFSGAGFQDDLDAVTADRELAENQL